MASLPGRDSLNAQCRHARTDRAVRVLSPALALRKVDRVQLCSEAKTPSRVLQKKTGINSG